MGDYLIFSPARKKGTTYPQQIASNIYQEFSSELTTNPDEAMIHFPLYIDRLRDIPKEQPDDLDDIDRYASLIIPLIGEAYPTIESKIRKMGLKKILQHLDEMPYHEARSQIDAIDEPWIISDIVINRPDYWPETHYAESMLAKCRSWAEFSSYSTAYNINRFTLAYSLIQYRLSTLPVRHTYCKKYPGFIDRTLDAAAAIAHLDAHQHPDSSTQSLENITEALIRKFDPFLQERIMKKINEQKWINLRQ